MASIPTNNKRPAVGSPRTVELCVSHNCGPWCNRTKFACTFDRTRFSLIELPEQCGWKRNIIRKALRGARAASNIVAYTAPCGRVLRKMNELYRYLRITEIDHLNVENFDFDPKINARAKFEAENPIYKLQDLSGGKENMPVSCVNTYNDTKPPPLEYSATRIPIEGLNLNLDENFLCRCDCEDDCSDKSRCQCEQLTFKGAGRGYQIHKTGYWYKRLHKCIPRGIYECNSRCKCKSNKCLNRVVQHPLQTRLQVFMTKNRGWGVRALNDIPKGRFVCNFTGRLLSSETSNLFCKNDKTRDAYLVDLDYIETVEQLKEGYETQAFGPGLRKYSGRRDRKAANAQPRQEGDRQRVNSRMSSGDTPGPWSKTRRRLTVRQQLFGENEPVVMDGYETGNLTRYINHSCAPNLFCQNVFVDTHDLRFPWVALFTKQSIKAGTELTWDYGYEVDSVPGKILFCLCGEQECRKRLL